MIFEPEEIKDALFKILEEELKDENFYLLDLDVKGYGRKLKITLTIDKKGGRVSANDTKRWAERLLAILKVEGIPIEPQIEVSSPGLDRELKTEREFNWAKGKKVKIITHKDEIKGNLLDFKENLFYIVNGENIKKIPLKEVKKIKLTEMED